MKSSDRTLRGEAGRADRGDRPLGLSEPDQQQLALIIHERFYCNRGYAAATGGLAVQSVNGLQ
jgi:hypothetical protein